MLQSQIPETKEDFDAIVKEYWDNSPFKKPIGWMLGTVMYAPFIDTIEDIVYSINPAFGELEKEEATVLHFTSPSYGVNWDKKEGKEPSSGALAAIMIALKESGSLVKYDDKQSESFYQLSEVIIIRALEILEPHAEDGYSHLKHENIQALNDILYAIQSGMEEEDFYGTTYGYGLQIIHEDTNIHSTTAAMSKFAVVSNSKVDIITDEKGQPALDIVLDGAFGACVNKAWSEGDPISLEYLHANEGELKATRSYPKIDRIDKFPVYLEEVLPKAVDIRILAEHNVRFGAIVSAGTTVMPRASYINFGAGTLGATMLEGSISSGVLVEDGSDIGGAASTQGVLSTGKDVSENIRTTIGKKTLLGAMSGLGVPLGDGCILDGGVTILPGTKVTIPEEELKKIKEINPDFNPNSNTIKAIELSMLNGIHIRYDSKKGPIYVYRSTREIVLNADLHT